MATPQKTKKTTKKKANANPTKQQQARKLTEEKKIRDAAEAVREAREAAQDLEITEASEWKKKATQGVKLQLPSGHVCLARNPGMEAFLDEGMVPNSLMPIVTAAIKQGQGLDPEKTKELAEEPSMLGDIVMFANRVLCKSVIQPRVEMPPKEESERSDDVLYADEVDMEDRLFILQWAVGGTKDLERFREQSADALEDLADVQEPGSEAE